MVGFYATSLMCRCGGGGGGVRARHDRILLEDAPPPGSDRV